MNFGTKALLPTLSIGLNDAEVATGATGAGGDEAAAGVTEGAASGTGDVSGVEAKAAGSVAAGEKAADAKSTDEATKKATTEAQAALTKSYAAWKPTLPEGIPFDEKGFGDYRNLFIEAGLKPEQAQKFVDAFAGAELGRLKAVAEGLNAESAGWEKSLKGDEELAGKDGKALDATMASARKAMGKLATKEFRELLTKSRLDQHPEMIRIMARAGKSFAEDSTSSSRSSGKGPDQSPAQRLKGRYDHPTSQEMFTK